MIKLEISKVVPKKPKNTNSYEIVVGFMEGDADGYEEVKFLFNEKRMNEKEFTEDLTEFISSIAECIKQDDVGRGGFDDPAQCIREYENIKGWSKFCTITKEIDLDDYEDLEPFKKSFFNYDFPTYDQGWYDSYDSLKIFYYDSAGDKHEVNYTL